MAQREHEHFVLAWPEAIEGKVRATAARDDELATSRFGGPADQGMLLQNLKGSWDPAKSWTWKIRPYTQEKPPGTRQCSAGLAGFRVANRPRAHAQLRRDVADGEVPGEACRAQVGPETVDGGLHLERWAFMMELSLGV